MVDQLAMLCVPAPTVDGEQTVLQFACRDHGKVWGNKGLQAAHDLIDFVSGIMEARRAKSSFAQQSARSDAMLAMSGAARLGSGSSRSEMFKEFLALLCEHLDCTVCRPLNRCQHVSLVGLKMPLDDA